MGALALASLAIGVAAPWVVKILEHGLVPVGGGAAIGHISQPGWLIEPGYAGFASISPTVLALTLTGFALLAAAIRYLASLRRARRVPVWASGVAVSGRRAQYTPIGYANMVRVIFNVVYRVRTQLRTIGDQRFPERLSMIRAEPRMFDPAWLYRPITGAFTRVADLAAQHPGRPARPVSALPALGVRRATADRAPARMTAAPVRPPTGRRSRTRDGPSQRPPCRLMELAVLHLVSEAGMSRSAVQGLLAGAASFQPVGRARGDRHRSHALAHDVLGLDALDPQLGPERQSVGERGDRDRLDVVGHYEVATVEQRFHTRQLHERQRSTRARSDLHARAVARG